jgi:murein tripeptide amidase MpaA
MLCTVPRAVFLVLAACLSFAASASRAEEPRRYDGYRIVRIDVKTQAELDALEQLGVEILNCTPGVGPMDALASAEQLGALRRIGWTPRVLQDDVQGMVDRQRAQPAIAAADPFTDFFLSYHPYDGFGGIVWYLNELVSRYPTLASMVNVGTTLEGRTIWGLRITSGVVSTQPAAVYFGCEHAREWIAGTVPPYMANYLLENYGVDPHITDLVDNVELFLIPIFNVDGYVYSWTTDRFWRKNRRYNGGGAYGVDINRNWGEGWGGPGSSSATNDETYRGTAPFSEPETRALRDFFIAHPNVRVQLDVHSYRQLILWPYGYTPSLSPDQSIYQEIGSVMKSLIYGVHGVTYNIGPLYTAIYPAAGVSVDWTYARQGILSYSYEARDTGFYGFALPADQIIANNEELLPATLHMTDSDWVRAPLRFTFPDGLPTTVMSGRESPIPVRIIPQGESITAGTESLHFRRDPSESFSVIPLTHLGGLDYQAVLPATNCTSRPQFYFSVEGDGGTITTNPRQSPAPQYYSAVVVSEFTTFFQQNLNSNPGWTTQGLWAWGQPMGGGGTQAGHRDPTSGHTNSYVYGYNLSGDYADNMPEYSLTSPAIDCTGRSGVHLTFWRWLGVEQPAYDHAYLRVSNNGINWTTVWQNEAEIADSAWVFQDFDISAAADHQPTVYLRWTMGSSNGDLTYCGWNIDDISLYSTECNGMAGDYNGDDRVAQDDFDQLGVCFSGPGVSVVGGCAIFDFDGNADVDLRDFAEFQLLFTRP